MKRHTDRNDAKDWRPLVSEDRCTNLRDIERVSVLHGREDDKPYMSI